MTEKNTDLIYTYIKEHCNLGVHPYQLAKALNLDKATVLAALKELEKQGKIRMEVQTKVRKKALRRKRYEAAQLP